MYIFKILAKTQPPRVNIRLPNFTDVYIYVDFQEQFYRTLVPLSTAFPILTGPHGLLIT